jgi:hypothetical protein
MHLIMLLLRLIHVMSGVLWVGGTVLIALFIEPIVHVLGPAGGRLMAELGKRRFHIYMLVVALLSILSGITLFGIDSAWFTSPWMRTPQSTALQLGGGIAIVAFVLGGAFTRPAVERLGVIMPKKDALPAGTERDALQAECDRLSRRLTVVGRWVATLLVLTAAIMATARYV